MSDNNYDITIIPHKSGWKITVSYWYFNRNKTNPRMTSETKYCWYTECEEVVRLAEKRRTKVLFSQIRVLARNFGDKERNQFGKKSRTINFKK